MVKFRVQKAASQRLDEIYRYTVEKWGREQADNYINGLFDAFSRIEIATSRLIPAEFGVDGYFFKFEKHIIYWRKLENSDIGIVTVLHERMHQIERFKRDFGV